MKIFNIEHDPLTISIGLTQPYIQQVNPDTIHAAFEESIKYQADIFKKLYYKNNSIEIINESNSIKIQSSNKKYIKELLTIFRNINKFSDSLYDFYTENVHKTQNNIENFFDEIIWTAMLENNRSKELKFFAPKITSSTLHLKFTDHTNTLTHIDAEKGIEFIFACCDALKRQAEELSKSFFVGTKYTYHAGTVTSDNTEFLNHILKIFIQLNKKSNDIYEMTLNKKGEYCQMKQDFFNFLNVHLNQQILENSLENNSDSIIKKFKL